MQPFLVALDLMLLCSRTLKRFSTTMSFARLLRHRLTSYSRALVSYHLVKKYKLKEHPSKKEEEKSTLFMSDCWMYVRVRTYVRTYVYMSEVLLTSFLGDF